MPDELLLLDVARAALQRHGGDDWTVRPGDAWCSLTPAGHIPRQHGWKLHLSATPWTAPIALGRAAEVLIRSGCPFTFATGLGDGRFLTAYPRNDDQFRELAARLHQVTEGLAGPRLRSDRPVRPGSLVHARYGVFTDQRVLTDDGLLVARMTGPDGRTVDDAHRAAPDWAVYPLDDQPAKEPELVGGRFRLRRAIRQATKGGVFRAVDEHDGTDVVVKQARAYVDARLDGTDVRDRLRAEARMLERLAPAGVAPAFVALVDQNGDLFLVERAIAGETLDAAARRRPDREQVAHLARGLIDLVRRVHRAGFVVGDLKPQNVMVTPDREVRLIDVEYVGEPGVRPAPAFISRYSAPEVRAGSGSEPSADCFSLGVTVFRVATGLSATWISGQPGTPRSRPECEHLLAYVGRDHPELEPFTALVLGLTEADPARRWSLEQAYAYLEAPTPGTRTAARPLRSHDPDRVIRDGLTHLRRTMTPDRATLWPTRSDADPGNAWHGAAGMLKILDGEALRTATTWVAERVGDVPRLLPGLAVGRAGTAWALHDAATALGDDRAAAKAVELAKRLPTAGPSPDITHGLSGAGLAHLHLWNATGDKDLRDRVVTYAEAVLAAARRADGRWTWPTSATADSKLAGVHNYGYAHGVAGAGAFLLAAGLACDEIREPALEAAHGAAETLLAAAIIDDGRIAWPKAVGSSEPGGAAGQWCDGPAGIGGFLIRMWSATGDGRYAEAAGLCATTAVRQLWSLAPGACCGLAGVGHFLLDLADLTGETTAAEHAAGVLLAQCRTEDGLLLPGPRESGLDYAGGLAGTLGFLLRLRDGGTDPWSVTMTA